MRMQHQPTAYIWLPNLILAGRISHNLLKIRTAVLTQYTYWTFAIGLFALLSIAYNQCRYVQVCSGQTSYSAADPLSVTVSERG